MNKSSDKNLDQLAKILAYNMVGSSFPESEKDAAFKEIFKNFKSQVLPSSRNVMIIGAIGIEIASQFYSKHNNLYFGAFCVLVGLIFLLFIGLTFFFDKNIHIEAKKL